MNIAFVCGLLGIVISTVSVAIFASREHRLEKRHTLSELAAKNAGTLREFRIILWTCGTLISIMMYFLVLPNLSTGPWLIIFYTIIIFCELTLAVVPAYTSTRSGKIHNYLAYGMGTGMLALAMSFAVILKGAYSLIEYAIFGVMFFLCILTIRYWDRFIYFQLPFIFLSHMSILIAAVAVLHSS